MKKKINLVLIVVAVAFVVGIGFDSTQEQFMFNQGDSSLKEFELMAIHLDSEYGMGEETMVREEVMGSMIHKFVMAGQHNPTIEVKQGDFVKLKLINTDKMMLHNLSIPSLNIQTETLGLDEYQEIEFVANTKGELEYLCTLHPDQMSGKIVIMA